MRRTITSILLIFLIILSCRRIVDLPPEPRIEFRSFEVFDTIDILGNETKGGRLKFYFEDGDGDLGNKAPGSATDDTTNLFLTLFRKNGDILTEADKNDPLYPSGYRIPYINRPGQNKIIKGTISVTFVYLFYEPSDTIIYEFYIKDRADHLSNTESTCEISLGTNGICNGGL